MEEDRPTPAASPRQDLLAAMRAFQQGDEASFEQVYRQLWGPVCRRAAKMGLRDPDCRDLAQKVLVRVYLHARDAEFDSVQRLWAWTYTITGREVFKQWRKKRPELIAGDLPEQWPAEPTDPGPAPPAAAAAGEVHQALADCLGRLDEPERMAVLSVLVQGLTFRGAARLAGLSLGRFKYRYEKALAKVRQCLQDKGHDI